MRKKKIRFVFMVLVGIIISLLLDAMKIAGSPQHHKQFFDFFIAIVITIFVWEGNLLIDERMNKLFPWDKKPGKRLLVHLIVSLVFSSFVIYLSMLAFNAFVCEFPAQAKNQFMIVSMIIGVLISIILLSIEVSTQFLPTGSARWLKWRNTKPKACRHSCRI